MRAHVSPDHVNRLREIVARCLGLHFDETRTSFLERLLERRLQQVDRSADAYLSSLEAEPSIELRVLAPDLTVGETYFFRNADQFRALAETVLPDRMQVRGADRRLRLLSAGCASGEEAFSLSMTAHDVADGSWDVSILAVDVNPVVLARAALARYTPWSLRGTAPELERRWFRSEGSDLLLSDAARSRVRFEERNLVHDDPQLWVDDTYDVVFCRNVLMYFEPIRAQAVVRRIARALRAGGYLFLGHAETLRGLSAEFHLRHTHGTFYYQRRDSSEGSLETGPLAVPSDSPAVDVAGEDADSWVQRIQRASARIAEITAPRSAEASPGAPLTRSTRSRADVRPALDLLAEDRYAEALESLRALPEGIARDPDALLLRAVLLTQAGRLLEAEETCARVLELDGLNSGAHYALALCREGASDRHGAIEHDQVAIYLDGSFAMPRLHLGLLARTEGDHETARRELAQALELLQREDASRVLLFGGGFRREALLALCRAELAACGGQP